MKKSLLILAIVGLFANTVVYAAQVDTVPMHRAGYFEILPSDTVNTCWHVWYYIPTMGNNLRGFSNRFYSQEPVTIYGVAAIYGTLSGDLHPRLGYNFEDTVLDHTYDSLIIHTLDSEQYVKPIRGCRINYSDRAAKYVYFSNAPSQFVSGTTFNDNHYLPVREAYFDSVAVVRDTFFVAPRFRIYLAATYDSMYTRDPHSVVFPNRTFSPIVAETSVGTTGDTAASATTDRAYRFMSWDTARYNYKVDSVAGVYRNDCFPFLFPILTPPPAPDTTTVNDSTQTPDSTGTGDDTNAAVLPSDLMQSFVTISPNPAADRVQVLSSFGLVAIEVYDADGRQVHAEKVSGLARTIDTGHWPRGIYMLHITTPYGPAVRKLVLR